MAETEVQRGFDRFVFFSDAVVAIAATLLILPLVDRASDLGDQTPDEFLASNGYEIFVFLLSFVVISRFWSAHHRLFTSVRGYTTGLLWLNMLWLITIVFLPFPTELIATAGSNSPTTSALYIGTMLLTSLAGVGMHAIVDRRPDLRFPDATTEPLLPALAMPVLMLVALVIAVAAPHVGLLSLLVLFLGTPLEAIANRMLARRSLHR